MSTPLIDVELLARALGNVLPGVWRDPTESVPGLPAKGRGERERRYDAGRIADEYERLAGLPVEEGERP